MIKRIIFTFIVALLTPINFLSAEEYFSTLRYKDVNLRQGPSKEYPVKIFYKKKYLPVLIQDTSDNFRKIKDHENNTGWIHVSQLSKKKAALVNVTQVTMFENSTIFSTPVAVLEKGRLCIVLKCSDEWCKIKTDKYSGWLKKQSLWGNL
jgi:SH3-like domain-containing protein|tara:strand:+ start:900 stop:1349 length:450 start_codon:yes stop_codon:yes gene_type:complete